MCLSIKKLMAKDGSRTLLQGHMTELKELLVKCDKVNEKLNDHHTSIKEFEQQEDKQVDYREKVADCLDAAQAHLERKSDATTIATLPEHVEPPTIIPKKRVKRRTRMPKAVREAIQFLSRKIWENVEKDSDFKH